MHGEDYKIWKSYPASFFRLHRAVLSKVIFNNCFIGHLNRKQQSTWKKYVISQMNSEPMSGKLQKFSHHSSFLVFYISHLKALVLALSQQEDLDLLERDFNRLIIKYSPLAALIITELTNLWFEVKPQEDDLLQQVLTNILLKKDKLKKLYEGDRCFKNYFWSVIKNESKNQIKAVLNKSKRVISLEDDFFNQLQQYDNADAKLSIEGALNILHSSLLFYTNTRARMVICLGLIFDIPVVNCEIDNLISECGMNAAIAKYKFSDIINTIKKRDNILSRFENYRELLNMADGSDTNAQSYWRWTNMQIARMIHLLNQRHLMTFNRETFRYLVDLYFDQNYDLPYPELPPEIVYIDKSGDKID